MAAKVFFLSYPSQCVCSKEEAFFAEHRLFIRGFKVRTNSGVKTAKARRVLCIAFISLLVIYLSLPQLNYG